MQDYEFLHPDFFYLLLLIPLLGLWYFFRSRREKAELSVSSVQPFLKGGTDLISKIRPVIYVLRLLSIALVILALARPRTSDLNKKTKATEGIDIVMAMDVSGSMLAEDLKPNRLKALKKVARDFVDGRPNDRIGLVVYAGESFTQSP